MPDKIWKFLPQSSDDLKTQLLANRGLIEPEDIARFFDPKLIDYEKDLALPNIQKAKKRILQAIEFEEQIIVYGDYDVDGVSASAVMYHGLKSLGAKVLPYIPHREKEGYGLSKIGIDACMEKDPKLFITVDNGIVALEQAKYIKSLGIDLIITDHHTPLDTKPEADVIVHSLKICGAAVAWCLLREMVKPEVAQELLQFVALGTVCDLMSLKGVNRALVVAGLAEINHTKNPGMKALIIECGLLPGHVGSFEIGFMLGPRINAVGRLDHAIDALRMFCVTNPLKATQIARRLCDINSERQRLTITAYEEAKVQMKNNEDGLSKIHILHSEKWNPGIIGLVAGRVCEDSKLPVIAISVGETISKGSARSIEGVNMIETIRKCADVLLDLGGHIGAAGFSLETTRLEEFKQRLQKAFNGLDYTAGEMSLLIEAEVPKEQLTLKTTRMLEEFAPFGMDNPKPILASRSLKMTDKRTLSMGKHIKLKLGMIDAIGFGMGERAKEFEVGDRVEVAYNLEINSFQGRETVQLKLKDIRVTS